MPKLIDVELTGASYGKRTYGVGPKGGSAEFFLTTKGYDYDKDDLAVWHRMIHLWNAAKGKTIEEVMEALGVDHA